MRSLAFLGIVTLLLGCPASEPGDASPDTESATTGSDGSDAPTGLSTDTNDGPSTGNVDTTGADADSDSTASTGGTADGDSSDDGPDPFLFEFDPTPPEDYTQIDRQGFPTVNVALNLFDDQDAMNALTPAEALAIPDPFLPAGRSLAGWHRGEPLNETPDNTGLDDDFVLEMWTPCPLSGPEDCLEQCGPLIYPDTLKLFVGGEDAFPNGRRPQDPVMDYILAVIWLDVGVTPAFNGTVPVTFFLDMDDDGEPGPSLNPLTNDVGFDPFFPYLAPPHEP